MLPAEETTATSTRRAREHHMSVFVSHETKQRVKALAEKYDRTTADMIRAILRIGVPMMEGLSEAEELMIREYVQLFRHLRKVKTLKDV